MNYAIFDIETYPNVFTAVFQLTEDDSIHTFEVSKRINERIDLMVFMEELAEKKIPMVGFNNQAFDYPVLHELFSDPANWDWYGEAQRVIESDDLFNTIIWRPMVPQIDLLKIHHFDNKARTQSLKGLEFALRMDDIQDLPFEVGTNIPEDKIDVLLHYNKHDVKATRQLFDKSIQAIEFRQALSKEYSKNFMNYSDVKCGTEVLIREAEKANPGSCYVDGSREPRQTKRTSISIRDILLPIIDFDRPEFKEVHEFFKRLTVSGDATKGAFKRHTVVDGFKFDYGLGGLHGSVESQALHSDDEFMIVDVDVASYYPNLAIVNDIYPEHLSSQFCQVYKGIYERRKSHAKGTPENAMLKLALNGAYGNSNNSYSPLYDPQYTMAITVNGQLLLSMLSEQLMGIDGCSMIQANTDGVTLLVHRDSKDDFDRVCKWWQDLTGLVLEEALYKSMFIRDVNNYIAVGEDGKIKRKGAYEYKYELHQDPSSTIVAMAAEAYLVHGTPVEEFIHNHTDPHPFTIRAKMRGDDKLLHGTQQQQKLTRYHMATTGDSLLKVMPPLGTPGQYKRKSKLTDSYFEEVMREIGPDVWDERIHTKNKGTYEAVRQSVVSGGHPVIICNHMDDFDWTLLDYDWYVSETLKLTGVFNE